MEDRQWWWHADEYNVKRREVREARRKAALKGCIAEIEDLNAQHSTTPTPRAATPPRIKAEDDKTAEIEELKRTGPWIVRAIIWLAEKLGRIESDNK